jgi:ubiquinone/menaquinone biosynthesis C-methylase UbiE
MTATDPFKGTAWYYARYRPGYPQEFIQHVVERFGLDGTGRSMDLGTGTGQLALPLAPYFEEVVAVDPEPEMLAEAAPRAAALGVTNIRWVGGGSNELPELKSELGMFRLVTMGASFHWMDREATLAHLAEMVTPTGGLVIVGGPSLWNRANEWQEAVKRVIQRWLGEARRAGSSTYSEPREREDAVLARSAFRRVERFSLETPRSWTLDEIVGNLYSTSFCSPRVLGEKREAFERDLRETLRELNPGGVFEENALVEGVLAWK